METLRLRVRPLVWFVDCNRPGTLYRGTMADVVYLRRDGGCPSVLSEKGTTHPVISDEFGPWTTRFFGRFHKSRSARRTRAMRAKSLRAEV